MQSYKLQTTKTCTAVGCFTSTNCVNLSCILSANNITTEEILIPFRIVKSLPINELIIGLQDVRKHKLTKVFSHLFEEKDDEQNLNEQINIENVDVAKATEQALLGEESSSEDFRRTIMSPQPKSKRQSTSNLRRSSRIKAGGSMNVNSSNAIYVQSQVD